MQKKPFRAGRTHTVLHQAIARFLAENANTDPFITVSYIVLNKSGTTVKAYCSVFPADRQEQALAFLTRNESACQDYLRSRTALRVVPAVRFVCVPAESV